MATKKYKNKKIVPSLYGSEPHYFAGPGEETQKLTGIKSSDYTERPVITGKAQGTGMDALNKAFKTSNEEPGYMDKYGLNWASIGAGAANAGMEMFTNLTEDDDLYDSGDINARGWKITSNLLGLGNSAYNLARPDASPEIQNQIKSNNAILDEAKKDAGQVLKINAMDDAANFDLFHSHVSDDIDTDYDLSRSAGETIAGIGSSMLEGAKSGSIGGPWGALGGAVAGLGAGLIGAFNGASQAKAAQRMRNLALEQKQQAQDIDFRNKISASKAIGDFNINNYRTQSMMNPDIILQGANYAALGGPLFTNGGIFDNGINYIGTGGTHSQNKLGGVPMGIADDEQPNLVEEGEVIWNGYVFSNRIKVPKKLKEKYKLNKGVESFADAVIYIQKYFEERPNDPIEKRTMDNILREFQIEQEIIRQRQAQREQEKMMRTYAQYPEMMQQMQMQQDPNAMQQMPPEMMMQQQMPQEAPSEGMPMMGAYGGPLFAGGGILIKPSKRGTFTAAATKHGMGVQEFANKVLANPEDYSPAMRKKANFARNFGGHKHAYGNYLNPDYPPDFIGPNIPDVPVLFGEGMEFGLPLDNINPYQNKTKYNYEGMFGNYNPSNLPTNIPYSRDVKYSTENANKFRQQPRFKDFTDFVYNNWGNWGDNTEEVMNYLISLEKKAGGQHLFNKELSPNAFYSPGEQGSISLEDLQEGAKEYWHKARTTGPWGYYTDTPRRNKVAGTIPSLENTLPQGTPPKIKKGNDGKWTLDEESEIVDENDEKKANQATPYKYKPDWMANLRYMPALGSAFGVLSDTMGWSNVPDYTYANELEQAAKRRPTLIGYKPIGDYMMHTPEDRNYMANQIAQQQNAGRRALIDNANGNIGATQMGLLGNSFNTGITLGDLYDKTQRASVDDRKIVNDFNRGTNQFNATAYNRAQEFNAGLMDNYLNRQYDAKAKSLAMKQAEDARVDAARQANLTTLFNNIGDIGWEAYNRNMINSNNALYYGTGRLGNSFYKNQWDDMTDEQRALAIQQMYPRISNPPQVRTGRPASGQSTTGKNGGYITIKNKRRK